MNKLEASQIINVILLVGLLHHWIIWKIESIKERQANCNHEWHENEITNAHPGPFDGKRVHRYRICSSCKKQEHWNHKTEDWDRD